MKDPITTSLDSEHQAMAEEHVSPGFLILSSSLNLLYRDDQAWKLCGLINRIQEGKSASGVLPPSVLQVCTQIADVLRAGKGKNPNELQLKHVISDRQTEILILATGLPDANDADRSEILVLMEEISRPSQPLLRSAKKRFTFTDREVSVVQHLLKGMTNKEIANEIFLSDRSVEKIRQQMKEKLGVKSTIGLLKHALSQKIIKDATISVTSFRND